MGARLLKELSHEPMSALGEKQTHGILTCLKDILAELSKPFGGSQNASPAPMDETLTMRLLAYRIRRRGTTATVAFPSFPPGCRGIGCGGRLKGTTRVLPSLRMKRKTLLMLIPRRRACPFRHAHALDDRLALDGF